MAADTDRQLDALKVEVVRLFECIQKIKGELASIKHPMAQVDHFNTVADQLNAIVGSTEMATQSIMEATEAILTGVAQAQEHPESGALKPELFGIANAANRIFESCAFHDITGQRISKIVRTMLLIEGTLNSLVVIMGENALAALPTNVVKTIEREDVDGSPLHGPALGSEGISQDEIDKLFG
ncbi:MAG: protein phosphatase CheZ [Magnetospirillum sp. WYHS-4]